MSTSSTLELKLTQLKLSRIREVVTSWIVQAEQQQLSYGEFLEELLAEELDPSAAEGGRLSICRNAGRI